MLRTFTLFVFSVFLTVFTWGMDLRELPVNPVTIPEYDTVAGVIMYWNPYSDPQYDNIVVQVIDGIQTQAVVYLLTNSTGHKNEMIDELTSHGVPLENIEFIEVKGHRRWIRDHGPFSIYDGGELAFIGFNDYAGWHGDKDLVFRLAEYWDMNYYDFSHIIFDGGNYLVDNHGQLFATERLYTNNPYVPQEEIDSILYHYMNIKEIHTFSALTNDYWGHIDMQIKLLNDTTFVISSVEETHQNYLPLEENYQKLLSLEHPEGKEYQVHKIQSPPSQTTWKTYINSLIVNDVVLVPVYDHELDVQAIETYEALLPGKTVIGIDCNHMIGWGGAIHCITNQIPPFLMDVDFFTVTFDVKDEEGSPVNNAVVTLAGNENPPGDYVFEDIIAGTYDYKVEKAGYVTVEEEVTVEEDVTVDVTMFVETYTVTFDVYLCGEPVTDAVVTFDGVENPPGDYVFEGIEQGMYDYKVVIPGFTPVEGQVYVDDDITVLIEGPPCFTVTFDVNDEEGNEITGAVVTFDGNENPAGNYVFENIAEGIYEYKVEKEWYHTVEDGINVDDDITVEVAMHPQTFVVDFIIEDNEGISLENAIVTLGDITNDEGDYIFENIKAGTYDYKVEKEWHHTAEGQVIVEDNVKVDVTLFAVTFTVEFNVSDTKGNSIEDATITLGDIINNEGDYLFEGITAGTYNYKVEKEGYNTVKGSIPVFYDISVKITMSEDKTHVVLPDGVALKIFPNPARDKFYIESSETIKQVRLINTGGQVIKDIIVNEPQAVINANNLRMGIYFMQIHTANSVITERVMVVR